MRYFECWAQNYVCVFMYNVNLLTCHRISFCWKSFWEILIKVKLLMVIIIRTFSFWNGTKNTMKFAVPPSSGLLKHPGLSVFTSPNDINDEYYAVYIVVSCWDLEDILLSTWDVGSISFLVVLMEYSYRWCISFLYSYLVASHLESIVS